MKILITGNPGCGKTTFIKEIFKELKSLNPLGFYTEEIREKGIRVGFALYDGDFNFSGILAHINFNTPYRVSKYFVNLDNFESFLKKSNFQSGNLIIIDEIGKMEIFSNYFKNLITEILNSNKNFIGTIALKGPTFIEDLKKRKDLKVFNLDFERKEKILRYIKEELCLL